MANHSHVQYSSQYQRGMPQKQLRPAQADPPLRLSAPVPGFAKGSSTSIFGFKATSKSQASTVTEEVPESDNGEGTDGEHEQFDVHMDDRDLQQAQDGDAIDRKSYQSISSFITWTQVVPVSGHVTYDDDDDNDMYFDNFELTQVQVEGRVEGQSDLLSNLCY